MKKMTSETYLDLTFDRTAKSGKRPIRPKLLKLTDVTIPHRNRKKTKVKTKDRSVSSVRDRIYDDPAYTDDISHLANPMRRSSCSGKSDAKVTFASISMGGSSSLGKRSKLTKEFLQYAKQGSSKSSTRGLRGTTGGGVAVSGVVGGGVGSYEHGSGGDISSSSDDGGPLRSDTKKSGSSMGRRGRSLERSMAEQNEKPMKRDKRDRSSKQKRNLSLDNKQQSPEAAVKRALELEVLNLERGLREKDRSKSSQQQSLLKQYSDGANDVAWSETASRLPPDHDELFSVRSSSKDSASNAAATKLQIGRRFLKGEIGIKSFNYYLLKEGLKSSKKFVEKQRNSLTSGLSGSSKKLHSRSEENIYEEIFFKDAPPSDEENQNQAIHLLQQQQVQPQNVQPQHVPPQHTLIQAGTPISQCSEDAIYPDCELCMQQCTKENCEYCLAATAAAAQSTEVHGGGGGDSQRDVSMRQYSSGGGVAMPQQHHNKQQYDSIGRTHTRAAGFINQVQATTTAVTTSTNQQQLQRNDNNNGSSSMPTAHILEFQSYNPNNPGVYKIETTPVAITGEYNPILQFQQSSPSTTTTTTPSEHYQQHHHHQKQNHQYQQQHQQQQQLNHLPSQGYLVQSSIPLAAAMTNHYHQGGVGSGVGVGGAGIMPMLSTQKHHQRGAGGGSQRGLGAAANGQQHFILSYNGAANVTTATTTAATMQRMNTKSSSSSDSLQQQQLHKFNTMARLEANARLADPFYGGGGIGHMHPLMYAASRPIGGSQILVDPYDLPQMYKSDSKASILSEYSLRSSDNSHHRYNRYRYGGRGEVSDSSLGDSLFSYNSAQRRYFGSSESCRFAFECRRCSLDGGEKCSYSDTCRYECRNCDCSSSYFSSDFDDVYGSIAGGTGGMHRSSGIPRKTAAGTLPSSSAPPPAADFERQQEQLDLKQNKYAQDFFKHVNDVKRSIYQSEMQRNSSSMDAPKSTGLDGDNLPFGLTGKSRYDRAGGSPHRLTTAKSQPKTVSTLPLTKERTRAAQQSALSGSEARNASTDTSLTPTPAPRTSLQQIATNNALSVTLPTHLPQPTQRRREYPSLDRLVATATGAIPKQAPATNSQTTHSNNNNNAINKPQASTKNNATNTAANVTPPPGATVNNNNNNGCKESPHQSPKTIRITDRPLGMKVETDEQLVVAGAKATATTRARSNAQTTPADEAITKRDRDCYLNVAGNEQQVINSSKRHHRSTSSKTSGSSLSSSTRRKNTPAPPPPSPATYSDLQELKANLESAKDDTKTQSYRTKNHKVEATAAQAINEQVTAGGTSVEHSSQKQQNAAYIKQQIAKDEKIKHTCNNNANKANDIVTAIAAVAATSRVITIETATKDEQQKDKIAVETAAVAQQCVNVIVGDEEHANVAQQQQKQQATTNNANNNKSSKKEIPTTVAGAGGVTVALGVDKLEMNSTTTMSTTTATAAASYTSSCATNLDANDDDDVFYDARSEDSGGGGSAIANTTTIVSTVSSSSSALKQVAERHNRRKDDGGEEHMQQYKQPQQQLTPQSQQIANHNKNIRKEEKLHVTKDSIDSAGSSRKHKGTHNDDDCGGCGGENENKKSKKDMNNETQSSIKKVDVEKVTNDMQPATTVAPTTATVTVAMALNLDEVVLQTPIPLATRPPTSGVTATADQRDTSNNNNNAAAAAATLAIKKEPAITISPQNNNNDYAKSKKHERRSGKQQQQENSRQHKPMGATTTTTTAIPTISCDTCCQLEECAVSVTAASAAVVVDVQQQGNINESMRAGKIKTSNTSSSSKERASKIKQEIKLKHEIKPTIASTTTTTTTISTTPTTCAEMPTTIAKYDTQISTAAVATLKDIGAQNANISTSNNNSKKLGEQANVSMQNVAATCLQTDDDAEKVNQTSLAITSCNVTTATSTTPAATLVEATSTSLNSIVATVAASVSTTSVANLPISCNSDIAGVATLSNSISNYNTVPITINTTSQDLQATNIKRPQLYRQDYSCLDSSEAQSDDSHLTRDSITRESQNDELSSSTHDKIDLSTLPLPALPPKKRRTRLRASPSRHHSSRRHDNDLLPPVVSVGGSDDPSSSHSHNKQNALSSSHVNASEVAPHLSAFQQYVAKRRESLEASTRSFNEKLEARRMHYHMGGGGGASGAAAGTTGVGGGAASGMHMMPTYLFGEHYYGMPHVQSRKSLTPASKEEIFLNKSGWVQVNTKRGNDENRGYRRLNYAHQNGGAIGAADMRNTIRVIQIDNKRRSDVTHQALLQHQHSIADPAGGYGGSGGAAKFSSSKVEELIQRNEDRLNSGGGVSSIAVARDPTLRPGYRIVDPQLASILNERPGFLPVKNLNDADSPPPITPILSPPPAFQDSSKSKHFDRRKTAISGRQQKLLPTTTVTNPQSSNIGGIGGGAKGMVFSRSFEYDARRPTPTDTYVETFSRSFDGNLSERPPPPLQRERSPNFSSLTGNSPNYLSKKDSGGGSSGSLRSRDSSPKYQQPQTTAYLNTSVKEAPPAYSIASSSIANSSKYSPRTRHERSFERSKSHNLLGRSRKSQFNRVGSTGPTVGGRGGGVGQAALNVGMSRFRSFDTSMSQRLNSCDSGARSDLSNDELDNDDEGSTEFLTTNYHHTISPLKTQRQRSLTPDRNESQSSSSSMRKQRSLTPESRSLTPEDRRKKGSQVSLMSTRQNSSSRSNTLERKQRHDEKQTVNISRSSSSSSYSGREHEQHAHTGMGSSTGGGSGVNRAQHRRSLGRNAKQTDEHRIRRSRSLQLSERSPNRSHKIIVSVGQSHTVPNQQPPVYQQANFRSNNGGGTHNNFPPTIRTTAGKSQSILMNMNPNNGSSGRVRSSEIDKSRSFDFDYCNYNNSVGATGATPKSHNSGTSSSNQNVPIRLDFDKSRSFDDDYREPINSSSNNLGANAMRYLQTNEGSGGGSSSGTGSRLRRSSPVGIGGGGGPERTSRSPQSSGSSCNNLNLPRQSTSPQQNYGTRLCDHELTYDMLRKSLDRSPIMDFRRGDSGDYDLPQSVVRNRETINSGGNSELNFLSNDARVYDLPLKQQRHAQSPSDSPYSLERLHNSSRGDSVTPDAAGASVSDYRTEYAMYRQGNSHAPSLQQHRSETRSNNRSSQQNTTTKIKAVKSPVSCSFWPHCGACNNNTILQQKPLTLTSSKRRNSLKNPRTQTKYDDDVCGVTTSGKNERASLLRRNHSDNLNDKHITVRNGNDGNGKINGENAAASVSTVSVNVNVIKLDKSDSNGSAGSVDKSCQRNKSQWTLLCSGVKPTIAVAEILTPTASQMLRSDSLNVKSTAVADAPKMSPRPRVTPLTATSLVFLGDCEMPITRDHDTRQRLQHIISADAKNDGSNSRRSRSNVARHASIGRAYDDCYSGNFTKEISATANNLLNSDNNKLKISTTTTRKDETTAESSPTAIYEYLRKARSLSLPNIFVQLTSTTELPKTTTANDGVNIIGIRNGFSGNLSHQIRAVSSPSLTDALQQETNNVNGVTTTIQLTSTSATSSVSDESTTPSTSCNGSAGGGSGTNNYTNIPTSQSVGVLQKFKRTLTNFSKNQQQYAPNTTSTNGSNSHLYAHGSNGASSTSALSAAAAPVTEMSQQHDITDSVSGKYRFGPLIWRSSKERRKTKYNRRDKCNSGDSGIQIELENDEQFTRGSGSGTNTLASTSLAVVRNGDDKASPKLRSVRRTNSAKATTIFDQTTAAMSAKAKILKRMENFNEREAPESLPTRSLSQPNGLETFGIGRTGDLDDSDDSDSVASHDEGPNYYPIYAEVLYNFTAAGPQELGLERGTLIEILRKEVGPWWFGRIKKEDTTLVEEILDPELGWFPKEFVRVIQYPEIDAFFLSHMSQMQSSTLIPTTVLSMEQSLSSPAVAPRPTTIPPSLSSGAVAATTTEAVANTILPAVAINVDSDAEADADADATVVDQNNVTTIVIESPATYNNSAVNASSSSSGDCALVPSRSTNIIMDSADVLRRSAVKELLDTEMNYVKLLASICEGYLPAMSKRIDIFSPNSIRLIFSNILAIYKFQRKFLEALRKGIEQNQIAKIFLKMHKGFLCYSTYCNAYPRALIELESYDRVKDAKTILDNCRESENLAELPLSAHLLAPVQRICRYPLHLGEIIKNAAKSVQSSGSTLPPPPPSQDLQQLEQMDVSQLDIPDTRETIDMALEAMKSITEAVNEGKRHSETIARHQSSFQNFKGPPLHLHSTRFFLQIDATRQKQNLWNSSCTLFLFDNQLIYCKRDIIKRSQFIYKGRIFLDRCRVVNVRDGKMFGHTIKNSLRIYCEARDKWFDFSFRSANRKHRFLNTLALERQFGGKALYVSEMAGFEYAFEERDFSDQSDYEMPDSEIGVGGASGLPSLRLREHIYDIAAASNNGTSGESSVPESPVKYKYNADTLPKKSQSRDAISGSGVGNGGTNIGGNECQTGSLGRRRIGNWFRKPKSSNSTPNHSPTHKPLELQMMPTETSLPNLTLMERAQDTTSGSTT